MSGCRGYLNASIADTWTDEYRANALARHYAREVDPGIFANLRRCLRRQLGSARKSLLAPTPSISRRVNQRVTIHLRYAVW